MSVDFICPSNDILDINKNILMLTPYHFHGAIALIKFLDIIWVPVMVMDPGWSTNDLLAL